jgi:hypothetical protein
MQTKRPVKWNAHLTVLLLLLLLGVHKDSSP